MYTKKKRNNVKRRSNNKKRSITKKYHRYSKKGGASDNVTFNSLEDLTNYLNKNKVWIDRVDVYDKKAHKNNEKPKYNFIKKDFFNLYEIGNVNQYLFQFY
jgi:uncharacterized Zn-finger protein